MTYPCARCNMDEGSPVCLQDERCPRHGRQAYSEQFAMSKYASSADRSAAMFGEMERLTRELANARAADIHSCHAGCTRAGCVNARLREDAERYRWLTSGEHGSKRDDWIWDCVLTEDQRKGHNDIDAAIDAARKAAPS